MFDTIISQFKTLAPAVDFWSLRLVKETEESLQVRQNILQPLHTHHRLGAMLTIANQNGLGYAATSDLSRQGLQSIIAQAQQWALNTRDKSIISPQALPRPSQSGSYQTPITTPWHTTTLADKIQLLQAANTALKIDDRIVDWEAYLQHKKTEVLLLTSDDIHIEQTFYYITPGVHAVANEGTRTQQRTGGGWGTARQGGLEQLEPLGFPQASQQVAEEALALLSAPECPTGQQSLLLMPSQMMLQIHESIGHPLELDRILGDERNYAGTSFVTLDMFGQYQYGSPHLNVTFDPNLENQLASYQFDDEGSKAEATYIIRHGLLERPLGGSSSQIRANMAGVANARACHWNRPPIDRMANLNIEPGNSHLDELIAKVERGVLMETNCSWSIDDSRNKFQFGCELGRLIEDGELKGLVRNPNYRGISATFWRNLAEVGNRDSFDVFGTPYCGKGEPNQMIHVGHASPACLFHDIEIFGGT